MHAPAAAIPVPDGGDVAAEGHTAGPAKPAPSHRPPAPAPVPAPGPVRSGPVPGRRLLRLVDTEESHPALLTGRAPLTAMGQCMGVTPDHKGVGKVTLFFVHSSRCPDEFRCNGGSLHMTCNTVWELMCAAAGGTQRGSP
jgi:hypothetical protein